MKQLAIVALLVLCEGGAAAQTIRISAVDLFRRHEQGELKRNAQLRLRLTGKVFSVKPIGMGTQTAVVHLTVDERQQKTVQLEGLPTRYLGWLRRGDPVRVVCERIRGSDPLTLYVAGCRVDRSEGDPGTIKGARVAVKRLKDEPWDSDTCRTYQYAGYLVCRYDRAMSKNRAGHDSLGNAMWRQCDEWLERFFAYCPSLE